MAARISPLFSASSSSSLPPEAATAVSAAISACIFFVKVGLAVGEVGLGRRALLGGMPQADVDLDVGLVYLVE